MLIWFYNYHSKEYIFLLWDCCVTKQEYITFFLPSPRSVSGGMVMLYIRNILGLHMIYKDQKQQKAYAKTIKLSQFYNS